MFGRALSVKSVFSLFLASFSLLMFFSPTNAADHSEAARVDGRALYIRWCSQCHGLKGKGDGINSTPDMAINPRNHTDASFMSTRTDAQFAEVIRSGGLGISKSPLMPHWSETLTEAEIKVLVAYLRELCNCKFEGVVSDEKLKSVDPGFR